MRPAPEATFALTENFRNNSGSLPKNIVEWNMRYRQHNTK